MVFRTCGLVCSLLRFQADPWPLNSIECGVGAERIVLKIREAGFSVVAQKDIQLTKDLVGDLYDSCKSKEFYNDLLQHMTRSVRAKFFFFA